MKYTTFKDIPKLTKDGSYRVNMSWQDVGQTLNKWATAYNLNLNPDFQRAHVWDEEKQIRYIEFRLRGGNSGRDILFNNAEWGSKTQKNMVLVDGKQRLEALRRFINNEIKVFDSFYQEYTDSSSLVNIDFIFAVNDLPTRADVLRWYIEINAGMVAHTKEEIKKVQELLEQEEKLGLTPGQDHREDARLARKFR